MGSVSQNTRMSFLPGVPEIIYFFREGEPREELRVKTPFLQPLMRLYAHFDFTEAEDAKTSERYEIYLSFQITYDPYGYRSYYEE